ncbi:MAG: hypothetical protein CVV44_23295 [Spirochaetae bacterium HGW-Spirochaetae-1]|jgi:HlyD family secretion protein|nr:MAG: hypothetical protein CVV44_23295 [Spirochaetae bacterium HGW-Spirochaetae-1]
MQIKGNKKLIYSIAGISCILALLLLTKICGNSSQVEYSFEKAKVGQVIKTVAATGVLDVQDKRTILSKIDGFIQKIYVNPDQRVKRGELLALIESSDIDPKILKLKTRLESTELKLLAAKRDYEGKSSLYKDNLISKQAFEMAELEYQTALNDHKLSRIDYNEILSQKNQTRIVSPISGIILSNDITQNSLVQPNQPLFFIAPDLSKMLLTINIDESDIGSVKKDLKVTFTVSAYPEKNFTGTIQNVSLNPIMKDNLVTYQSMVVCDNSELLLRPGMTATSTIIVAKKEKVLYVPNQAFLVSPNVEDFSTQGGKFVWIKNKNLVKDKPLIKVKVETGLSGDMYTEIIKNLKDGEEVLVKVVKSNE